MLFQEEDYNLRSHLDTREMVTITSIQCQIEHKFLLGAQEKPTFPSRRENTAIKLQTCLGRSLYVQSQVHKHQQLPERDIFCLSQGLEEKQGHRAAVKY